MITTKSFSIVLLLTVGFLMPCAGPVAAADNPFSSDAVEKAAALAKASSELGVRRASEAKRREAGARTPANAGFEKFLKLKNLCAEKIPGGEAFDLLTTNFKAWDGGEAPVRKVNGCLGPGDHCSSSIWCCGAMACRGGVCAGGGPNCIRRGQACGGSIWCCGAAICNDQGYCQ